MLAEELWAPKGKLRLIHVDARDHEKTVAGDFDSFEALFAATRDKMAPELEELYVCDEQGHSTPFTSFQVEEIEEEVDEKDESSVICGNCHISTNDCTCS